MGTVQLCEAMLIKLSKMIRRVCVTYGEYKNIARKKALWSKVTVDSDRRTETETFFRQNYGKKVPLKWHRLYASYTGTFCVDYFPEILFSAKLEPILNPYREAGFLGDKNLLEPFFSGVEGVRLPRTYFSCVRGVLRNRAGDLVGLDDALEQLRQLGKCVVKKTIGTSSGRDVMICDFGCEDDVKRIIRSFGNDFIVQELIRSHHKLSALNPTSLNTFRVMTYFCNGELHCCPLALRLGRSNADRDNIHYGGICVGVNEDGTLRSMLSRNTERNILRIRIQVWYSKDMQSSRRQRRYARLRKDFTRGCPIWVCFRGI